MPAKSKLHNGQAEGEAQPASLPPRRPSSVVDTGVIYCGDNLEQPKKPPPACVDLMCIDPPFNPSRNYETLWGEIKEKRALEGRRPSTQAHWLHETQAFRTSPFPQEGRQLLLPLRLTGYKDAYS